MSTRWAYLNGEWVDDRTLSVPVGDLGFSMGVTVTERLRTFAGIPFRKAEHLARMRRSCEIVGLPAGEIAEEFDGAISGFVARNADYFAPGDDWAIVAFATPGSGDGPTRCVHGFPLPFAGWAHQFEAGVALHTSDHRQTPANCWPTELKCRSRMHYYLADRQAGRLEPGARALLLDQQGFVGEASTANIVLHVPGEGVVSPHMERVLPGISVAVVREIAERQGVPFVERDILPEEIVTAGELWLTSTSVCLLPVVRCDDKPIGAGKPGPAFSRFLSAWGQLVGVDIAEQARRFATRSG